MCCIGVIQVHSTHTYRVEGVPHRFKLDQTIKYKECAAAPPTVDTQRLAVKRNFITFDQRENVVRYAQTNRVTASVSKSAFFQHYKLRIFQAVFLTEFIIENRKSLLFFKAFLFFKISPRPPYRKAATSIMSRQETSPKKSWLRTRVCPMIGTTSRSLI